MHSRITCKTSSPNSYEKKTKDAESRTGLFESTRTPGGVLLSKAVVDGDKDGGFWVKFC